MEQLMPAASIKDKMIQISGIDYLCKPFYSGIGSILMFHQVLPPNAQSLKANGDLQVTPELLEGVIHYLKSKNYQFLSLDEIADRLQNPQLRSQRFVAFTFDDGYRDNLTYAYPIFKKYAIPFTIYVTTSFPDKTAMLWWYLLEDLVLNQSVIKFKDNNNNYHYKCKTLVDKEKTFNQLRHFILHGQTDTLEQRAQRLFVDSDIDIQQKVEQLVLSWSEIQQLDADPIVTIGAHTVNHYALKQLSHIQARGEIQNSKDQLEAKLGHEVRHFAYPFGSVKTAGPRDFGLAKACGFLTATTTRSGNIFKQHCNHMQALPRINIREKKFGANVNYLRQYLNGLQQCVKKPLKRIM